MPLHPNGVHHLAISTRDIKAQIQFFTDVLGGSLKALYWMHGAENTFHGFVELDPQCYLAFVQQPDNPDVRELGLTHAGNPAGAVAAGVMQHVAMNVDTLDDLLALRDRIRSRGVAVFGPMNHGMCQSIYFAGPEGLCLEIATGGAIDARAWLDPEVVGLAGFSADELARCVTPAEFTRPSEAVTQPADDPAKPRLAYAPEQYAFMLAVPDEAMWSAVPSEPPVRVF